MQNLTPGTKLNNKYKILRTIGHGGFAFTYEGENVQIGLRVCIKELFVSGIMDRNVERTTNVSLIIPERTDYLEKCKGDFLREGKILGSISNSSVVRVIDYFEENNTTYIVLEYLEGRTLKEYVLQEGVISSDKLLASSRRLLAALEELHSTYHLMHRDIAPDNIMIRSVSASEEKDDELVFTLFDFGTAREEGIPEYTCVFKDGFSPVEQIAAESNQGPFTDIYAFCATLWYCLVGEKPESAYGRLLDDGLEKPSRKGVAIDPRLESILMKGLAVLPSDRYQSAGEMLAEIEKVLPSEPAADSGKIRESASNRNLTYFIGGGILALIAALVIIGLFLAGGKRKEIVYDPETMYKVTLTPDDSFTVNGYNHSIHILKDRLGLFAKNSSQYSLNEKEGTITLLLNKADFFQAGPDDTANYGEHIYNTAQVPEYVLRAYLTRACHLFLRSTVTTDTLEIDQTKDLIITKKEGQIPGIDPADIPANAESYPYFEVAFSDRFIDTHKDIIKKWNHQYALYQDPDCSPPLTPFYTYPMDNDSGFYLLDRDDGFYVDLLEYNLTHEPLEQSFTIQMEKQVNWQEEDEYTFGKYQVSAASLEKANHDTVSYFVYGIATDGELSDTYLVLRKRLDSLEAPYALGEMNSLTGLTKGSDAPLYSFIGIETAGSHAHYLDIYDLVFNSHHFYLRRKDGSEVELSGRSLSAGRKGITVSTSSLPDKVFEPAKDIFLAYGDAVGRSRVLLMKAEADTENGLIFSCFANGNAVSQENQWVTGLICVCAKNLLPVDLIPYDSTFNNTIGSSFTNLNLWRQ